MGIDDEWRERLAAAWKRSGKSMREVSLGAKLAHGYLKSLLGKEHKDPSVQNLARICDQLGVTLSFVLYGYELTPESEEVLRLLQAAPPGERDALVRLLKSRHGA